MNEYLKSNRELWNTWTRVHVKSKMYDVEGFKRGDNRLDAVVRAGLGDVRGKSLLHLQCHFGLDTLNWARLGARVTGADFSEEAITTARALAREVGLDANFVCANIYDLPNALDDKFDIVFTSHGVLSWLPDLNAWGRVIAHFLKPGGTFFIAEGHPAAYIFDDDNPNDLRVRYPYFHTDAPGTSQVHGSYADRDADVHCVEYWWAFSIGDVINALTRAGLRIESLDEFPYNTWQMYPFMEQDAEGWWRLPARFPALPLMFALRATAEDRPQTAEGN
ncbi:MAG: class I SAM-dependent methyltransferase [Chloroflexi bacterium]|nr:class I SAM-dependent methyltransferase [Chloroflexota bacterium]